MNKFIFNLILLIVIFLCAVGFTIASIASGIEVFKILAINFIMWAFYQLGWVLGFCWGINEDEK